jgi:hypothetical protein
MIKLMLKFIIFTLIYFTLHILLLNHFRKQINIPLIFKRSLLYIDLLTLTPFYLTLLIPSIFPKSHEIILAIYFNKKDWLVAAILLFQAICHIGVQLLFQQTKTFKSASIILNSSMSAYTAIFICILIRAIIPKHLPS